MKVESSNIKNVLFNKKNTEFRLSKLREAIETYSTYIAYLKKELKKEEGIETSSQWIKIEILDREEVFGQFATEYNETMQYYEFEIMPKVSKIYDNMSSEPLDADKLLDLEKEANRMAEIEFFGDVQFDPENVEHTKVIASIKESINNHEDFIESVDKGSVNDEVSKSFRKLLSFNSKLQVTALKKRLAERVEYHEKFMKVYNEDMKDCKKNLENYIERAKALSGIDITLGGLLDQHEKHKDDKEKLWLFFTTLRTRVNSVIQEMLKNPKTFDPIKTSHLIAKIS